MVGRAPLFMTHFSSKSHITILAKTGPKGDPIATPSIWSYYWPSKTKWLLLVAKASKSFKTERGSFGGLAKAYNFSRQICIVSSSGTLVKRELTSKEHIYSPL